MSSEKLNSEKIFKVTRQFTHYPTNWKAFARDYLKLKEYEISDIEQDYDKLGRQEQKYQMVRKWEMKNGSLATGKRFHQLVEKYWEAKKDKESMSPNTNNGDAANACERVEEVKVVPCNEKTYKSFVEKKDHYPIDSFYTKGCALIMNNSSFKDHEDWKRPGSELDVSHMRELWKGLGCKPEKVIVKENEPAAEMEKILKSFAEKLNRKYNFIVVVIMSHGKKDDNREQVFFGADSMPVKVDSVLKLFNNENAKHLQNIPKLFFFQFCRGGDTDKGVALMQRDGASVAKGCNASNVKKDSPEAQAKLLPTCSDQLVAYATHDRFTALRNKDNGSWFINAVTNIFMKNARDEHVLDLLTKVNKAVKEETGEVELEDGSVHSCKEMSNFDSNLTEKLYFLPGYPLNDDDIEGI